MPIQKENAIFSIIGDEVTDKYANQEVLSVCLRFLDLSNDSSPQMKEVFFDFVNLHWTTGEAIANAIMLSLARNNIDIAKARGQAYDGAAAMSSEACGVQGRIKRVAPLALYTHCNSHVLHISIASACKLPAVRNMIGTINETYLFYHYSPKRQRFLEQVLGKCSCTSRKAKLKGLCKTSWVERHECYETFYQFYEYVCISLEAIVDKDSHPHVYSSLSFTWDRETTIKAQGLLASLKTFEWIITFLIAKNSLETVKPIAAKLQKRGSRRISSIFYD